MKTVLAFVIAATLAVPAVASAQGDPIMPLSQVQRGMRCTALSVIHGTEVSSFDTDVLFRTTLGLALDGLEHRTR